MKWIHWFFLLLILPMLSGCLALGWGKPHVKHPVIDDSVSVEVLREDDWAAGGTIVFIPFAPGPKAEAGPTIDHISLVIVKGASDVFLDNIGVFQLITEGDPDKARFSIEGHIEEFDAGSKFNFFGLLRKKVIIKIRGEVRARQNGDVVALIFGVKQFNNLKDAEQMAYNLGRTMGQKIQH